MLVARFNLRPDPKERYYYRVFIFDTRAAMHKAWRDQCAATGQCTGGFDFAAQASSWELQRKVGRRWVRDNCVGQVIFHLGSVNSGIVSHEMTHAALYFTTKELRFKRARRRFDPVKSRRDDERLAWVQGYLTGTFWRAFYRRDVDKWRKQRRS